MGLWHRSGMPVEPRHGKSTSTGCRKGLVVSRNNHSSQGETRFSTTSPIAENIHRQPTRLLVSAPSLVKINYFAERFIAQKTATTGGTPNTMRQSKAFLIMSLAVIIGCGSLIVSSVAVSGDDLVYLCYRNKTIQVPFYLKPRYTSKGALNGPCPTSPP